ncbi:semaphorin-7A isoform X1 [Gadus morhua]|uniref:Si:ch211-113g11.6 n=1 Tax=Gadus morhua TaxID=8049 RepID=A0A8C4Z8A3_GADMO|nr:semaphorin-7A-like isoform X1 [Gadus morhua]XP_056457237.1 semaphorin-7A isoform X1 [Gadus chalcogrammus]
MNYLIFMSVFFSAVLAEKSARLKFLVHGPPRFHFAKPENYISMYHQEGTNTLYVGGKAMVFILTFTDRGVRDLQIPVESDDTAKATCMAKAAPPKLECDNFITVVQKVNDTFVVCGTNAGSPKCWLLVNETVLTDAQGSGLIGSPSDISPPYPSQKAISLATDGGSLYSALSSVGGHTGSIRRTFGSQKLLKAENVWLLNPQFAGAAIIPSSLKYKEEIYFFFSEFNKTARVDEEPYRARIGRICTVDEGGIKPLLTDSWTTFMKARMMCGSGSTQQQYNNIRQAVVLTAQDKRAGVLYGLFSNPWGRTVICAYSIEDIDQAFSTSKLRGYSSPFTGNRPGTCVRRNSTAGGHNDIKNLGIIRYHPEIEDVIRPVGVAPLDLPTDDQITHTVADIVLAVNDEHYSVLYLGTEQGKVLKVLHTSEDAFVIAQYTLFHNEGPVQNMAIDGPKGHLYVGTAMEVQRLQLADCGRYGDTCRDCILSRDPYCGWDRARRKCVPIPTGYNITTGSLIQNLDQSNASVCGVAAAAQKQHKTSPKNVVVGSSTSVFLPCPVRSFHATYRWEMDNFMKSYPCLFSGDSCVLGPTAVDLPLKEGVFRCMATEDGVKTEVISYRLVYNAGPLAASLASTLGSSLLLAVAALWLL